MYLFVLELVRPLRVGCGGLWVYDVGGRCHGQDELARDMRLRQESAARQGGNPGAAAGGSVPRISIGNIKLNGSRGRVASLLDLAPIAQYISRQPTLRFAQTRDETPTDRRGASSPLCRTGCHMVLYFSSTYRVPSCGWVGSQLLQQSMLPHALLLDYTFCISTS